MGNEFPTSEITIATSPHSKYIKFHLPQNCCTGAVFKWNLISQPCQGLNKESLMRSLNFEWTSAFGIQKWSYRYSALCNTQSSFIRAYKEGAGKKMNKRSRLFQSRYTTFPKFPRRSKKLFSPPKNQPILQPRIRDVQTFCARSIAVRSRLERGTSEIRLQSDTFLARFAAKRDRINRHYALPEISFERRRLKYRGLLKAQTIFLSLGFLR